MLTPEKEVRVSRPDAAAGADRHRIVGAVVDLDVDDFRQPRHQPVALVEQRGARGRIGAAVGELAVDVGKPGERAVERFGRAGDARLGIAPEARNFLAQPVERLGHGLRPGQHAGARGVVVGAGGQRPQRVLEIGIGGIERARRAGLAESLLHPVEKARPDIGVAGFGGAARIVAFEAAAEGALDAVGARIAVAGLDHPHGLAVIAGRAGIGDVARQHGQRVLRHRHAGNRIAERDPEPHLPLPSRPGHHP
jgi:hypothetical protein